MNGITKSSLSLPIEKRVGELTVRYSIEKKGDIYALRVSSSDLSEGCVFVEGVARDRVTAENIKSILAENFVSPLHVFDVLESIMANDI